MLYRAIPTFAIATASMVGVEHVSTKAGITKVFTANIVVCKFLQIRPFLTELDPERPRIGFYTPENPMICSIPSS